MTVSGFPETPFNSTISPRALLLIDIDWKNLSELYLERITMRQLWPMLGHIAAAGLPLTDLSIVRLNTRGLMGSFGVISSPICLPTVTHLSLRHIYQPGEAKMLLDNLKVPALQSLTWDHSVCWDDVSSADNLISFIKQSGNSLRSLFILNGYEDDRMCDILEVVPALKDLSIDVFGDITWLLCILSQRIFMSEASPFLPILERLHITICNQGTEWTFLPAIFIEDPFRVYLWIRHHRKAPTIPIPHRARLRISIHRNWINGTDCTLLPPAFNIHDLIALAELWQQHGIFCVFKDFCGAATVDVIASSFMALRHKLDEDTDYQNSVHQALHTISMLSF